MQVSVYGRKKILRTRQFVEQCIKEKIFSPSEMSRKWNKKYGLEEDKGKTPSCFQKAMRRMGISAKKRLELKHEAQKETELKDIEDYPEVKAYIEFADFQQVGRQQKRRTLKHLRELWEIMNCTNPNTWVFLTQDKDVPPELNLIAQLKKRIGLDEMGQWKRRNKVLELLGAFNRCFQGRLPKGWSMGLKREAGELKDFMEFDEFQDFIDHLTDTQTMSLEGWEACYKAQVEMGCREGTKGNTGIVSLRWENINYNTKRCKIRDKGKKGKPARLWTQIPLNLFYWLNTWECLMKWHEQRYGYRPTQERHATGLVFPINYDRYREMFHRTRKACNSRINQNLETLVPHIFRKTHAQWCKRIGISLENLCGNTESSPCIGRYGVGWDDPKIPLKYYLTPEPEEYKEQDQKIQRKLEKLRATLSAPIITWENVSFGVNDSLPMQ